MRSIRRGLIVSISLALLTSGLPLCAEEKPPVEKEKVALESADEAISKNTKLKGRVSVDGNAPTTKESPILFGVIQTMPKGTKVDLRLSCNLNSEISKKGDEIFAQVCIDVKDGQKVMLPGGWSMHGIVSDSASQRRLGRDGYVEITFDKLISPDGEIELPVATKFSTRDNQLKAVSKILAVDAGYISYGAAAGAIISAQVASIPVAIMTNGISLGVGAAAGATIGAIGALKRKGKVASIYPGDAIRLTIAEPIALPGFNPNAIPSAVKAPGVPGLTIKTDKITYSKSLTGDTRSKQMTVDLTIDNRSDKEISFFDIAVVDESEEKNFPSLFGNYLPFGKHVAQGTSRRATLSFSVNKARKKYTLVLLDRAKRNELMRVPIN